MSHIAEVYAKDLGVKIGRPHITDHFFPGLPNKYITIQSSNNTLASVYKNWEIVVFLIAPYLHSRGIKIIQIGKQKDKEIKGVDYCFLKTSDKQTNHIIKNAAAHIGHDSAFGHIASIFDVPSVILHFNLYPENSKPIWHKKNKCISVSPDFSKVKPSFSLDCNRINEIKPEIIAQNTLDQLNICEKIKFKTIRVGSSFHNTVVEIVPNFYKYSDQLKEKPINIRGDIHWDAANVIEWCRYSFVNLYINCVFDTNLLQYMTNLKQVVYNCTEDKNTDNSDFFKTLKNNKINVVIRSDELNISDVRLKYFDFNVLENDISVEKTHASKFLSNKSFVSNAEVFNSESSANRLDRSNNFVYDEASSKELENLYLYDEE